jgi:DNA-binding LacI/PurR family transcriptional regulator
MNGKHESRRKPGIKEVAEMTGFSPATVSLVLNNKGSFSNETKQAIRQAYSELSHDLAINEGKRFIRLLIEQSDNLFESDPYNREIIQSIESECRLMGVEMVLTFVREGADVREWPEGMAGLILLGGGLITDDLVTKSKETGIPLVLVDNYTHKGDVLSVHSDHYGAGFLATEYLIGRGHTRIGFISGPAKYKPLVDRYAGYCSALMEYGLPLVPEFVSPNLDRKYIKGYYEMKYLLELKERPTGVFAVSDRSAFGAMQAIRDMGIEMGQEIDLIGCDNIRGNQEIADHVATVHVPRYEVGQMAVRFLIEAIKGNTLSGKVVIPGRLVVPGANAD